MKKGFTLIELLAVIVILAIIALIASPIVIGLIEDARVEAAERSTEAAINAAKSAYSLKLMKGETFSGSIAAADLDMDNKPSAGSVTINTTTGAATVAATEAAALKFGNYYCKYDANGAKCAKTVAGLSA